VPSATAILDRFLHHAEIVQITGKSYRLRNQERGKEAEEAKANETPGASSRSKPARGEGGASGSNPARPEGGAQDSK